MPALEVESQRRQAGTAGVTLFLHFFIALMLPVFSGGKRGGEIPVNLFVCFLIDENGSCTPDIL